MKPEKRILAWLIIVYVLTVAILSVAPTNSGKTTGLGTTSVLNIRSDYLLHALLFIPWMALIHWRWNERTDISFYLKSLVAGLLLAAVSEGVQYWLPYRSFNVIDLGANWLGVVIGGMASIRWVVNRQ